MPSHGLTAIPPLACKIHTLLDDLAFHCFIVRRVYKTGLLVVSACLVSLVTADLRVQQSSNKELRTVSRLLDYADCQGAAQLHSVSPLPRRYIHHMSQLS